MEDAALDCLRLALATRFTGAGGKVLPLMEQEISAADWLAMDSTELERRGVSNAQRRKLLSTQVDEARDLARATHRAGLHLLYRGGPDWPTRLANIPDPPWVLWAEGELELLPLSGLCVVGARHVSSYGRHATKAFVETLALSGLTIWSGLARGVDGEAHLAALDSGGKTVGILGGGLREIYPMEHRGMAARILEEGGLLLAEVPPHMTARAWSFPSRNRLLAALSEGVLVIEAGLKSGTIITALHATAYSRPVWALPGPYQAETSRGCHALIRDGAFLADSPQGLLTDLGLEAILDDPLQSLESAEEAELIHKLRQSPMPLDAIVTEVGKSLPSCLLLLSRLESRGWLRLGPGGLYEFAPRPGG
jgi:DNA processing protein